MPSIYINDNLEIPESQLTWTFARSSGPGGQNVNKVNSKATLRWTPAGNLLSEAAWRRFLRKAKRYVTTEGEIVIQSQQFRDQAKNVAACTQVLVELIAASLIAPKKRIATKPSKAARQRRLDDKKSTSNKKNSRRQNRANRFD